VCVRVCVRVCVLGGRREGGDIHRNKPEAICILRKRSRADTNARTHTNTHTIYILYIYIYIYTDTHILYIYPSASTDVIRKSETQFLDATLCVALRRNGSALIEDFTLKTDE